MTRIVARRAPPVGRLDALVNKMAVDLRRHGVCSLSVLAPALSLDDLSPRVQVLCMASGNTTALADTPLPQALLDDVRPSGVLSRFMQPTLSPAAVATFAGAPPSVVTRAPVVRKPVASGSIAAASNGGLRSQAQVQASAPLLSNWLAEQCRRVGPNAGFMRCSLPLPLRRRIDWFAFIGTRPRDEEETVLRLTLLGYADDICQALRDSVDLNSRELRALQLALAGHSNKEIADDLMCAERTVKGWLASATTTLGGKDRASTALLACWRIAL